LIGTSHAEARLTGTGTADTTVDVEYVTDNFFPALGIDPAIGRVIAVADDRPGQTEAPGVASWSFWKNRLNLDAAILGMHLSVDGRPVTLVGVAPPSFTGLEVGSPVDLWLPVAANPALQRSDQPPNVQAAFKLMGRLQPAVSLAQARAEMSVLDRARVEDLAK